jgi:DNA-binding response OmpR family regulator
MALQDARQSCSGLSVLVIDDNQYLRDVVRAILELEGAVVCDAATLEHAQALLETSVTDAIVTDLQLWSEERAGVVLLEHVKRRFPVCAVLVLTDRADAYDGLCGIGFDAVLLKPTSTSDLIAAVLASVGRCRRTANRQSSTAA